MFRANWNIPGRYLVAAWAVTIFLTINTALRLGLIIFEAVENGIPHGIPGILAVGLLYDLAAASFLIIPFAVVTGLLPNTRWGGLLHGALSCFSIVTLIFCLLFVATAEVLFWNEFGARFNFIAVDYLVYTRETIGNIQQSYPVGPLMAALVAVTALTFLVLRRPVWRAGTASGGVWHQRLAISTALLLLPAASLLVSDGPRDMLSAGTSRELAENGSYEFVRAFRSNDLDFHTFYLTMDPEAARKEMRHEFAEARSSAVFVGGNNPVQRRIDAPGPFQPLNVVLVTMESFGAELTESLGGRKGLSPNLDRFGREGLFFRQMYATGTRTVRGLEAISMSIPPTPGNSVLKRANNKGYQTLGGVLKSLSYDTIFFYGGYSYFDNMADFFGGNGYEVIDRGALGKNEITHETIWGVADEDMFRKVLSEMDTRHAAGRRVFAHIMTTSNHRPFTYPAGRVAIPSGTSRDGAASYSDWAIGDFVRKASERPWFKDTLFVFIADHTSEGRGRNELMMKSYHIPMIIYSPAHIRPGTVDAMASQIDVAPTLLALLNVTYTSDFFGQDIMTEGQAHRRALISNYLTVGHVEDGVLVELSPKRTSRVIDLTDGKVIPRTDPRSELALFETIAHFQTAADFLKSHKGPGRGADTEHQRRGLLRNGEPRRP
jgi:phosphoglycerol transferase MdoB-like AlkP superfamily enzyme